MTSFKDDNLRFALLKSMVDAATEELAEMREKHIGPLLERYDEEGTKSFSVRLPGTGALIGALTLPEPKDKYEVTDEAAFTAWFADNHPDAVTTEVIPGEPERTVVLPATPDETVTTINPKHRTAIMKALDQDDDGKIVDTVTGSFVDGVTFSPGKRPDKFSVTYEPKGRELLAAAYRTGELNSLVGGTTLPAIGDRVIVERHLEVITVAAPDDVDPEPSPARSALEAHADEIAARMAAGRAASDIPDDPPCRYCGVAAVVGCECATNGEAADFDPGDWGAPSGQTGTGW